MLPVLPPRTEDWAVAQGQYWWSLGISCIPVTGSVGLVEAGRESCDSSCDTTSAAALSEVDVKSIRAVISNLRACPKFLACYWNVLGFHCMWWNGGFFFIWVCYLVNVKFLLMPAGGVIGVDRNLLFQGFYFSWKMPLRAALWQKHLV